MSGPLARGISVWAVWVAMGFGAMPVAGAQTPEGPDDEAIDDIIVEGQSRRGTALSDVKPELSLTEADIAAYGVSNLAELLAILQAETSSGRGRRDEPPVVLINGRRVSGFRELDNYPIETIARVDVLPEEVSLQYGFSANQRVINFILKPNISITPINTRTQGPVRGGAISNRLVVSRVVIDGEKRNSLEGFFDRSPGLFESDREIIPVNGRAEEQPFRSLTPDSRAWRLGASRSTDLPAGAVGTLSASLETTRSDRLNGFASAADVPLGQRTRRRDGYFGLSVNSRLAPNTWSLTASVDYDRINNAIELDGAGSIGPAESFVAGQLDTLSVNWLAQADFIINRRLFATKAGYATFTGQAGIRTEHQRADQSIVGDLPSIISTRQSRQTYTARASVNYPFLLPADAFGDIALNANAELNQVSDFGLLTTIGYGLTWRPGTRWRIIASATHEEGVPDLFDVASPIVTTPAAQVFDFTRQESVLAAIASGGNPALTDDSRDVFKVGIQWEPWEERQVTLNLDYTNSSIEGETRQFLLLTEEFEEAFPDRVTRDETGGLVLFDRRPVQVAQTERQQLRTGFTWSKQIKAKRVTPRKPAANGAKPRKRRRRSGRPGAIRASVYHRWTLEDQVTIRDGVAPFDFLNGAATGAFGGTPAHVVDGSVYRWNNGWGLYAGAQYRSGTQTIGPNGTLRFSDIFRAVVSVSYEFNFSDAILDQVPFLEETRVSMGVGNLFDDVITVRDEAGETPLTFQPNLIDPIRTGWRFELRKRL
ncbi:MAG: hypothetical protein AAFY83_04010 [Pseudomonadota bacterium]